MKSLSTISSTKDQTSSQDSSTWHFLTNHAHVLLCLSVDLDMTVRDLSQRIGITERAVIRIIGELDESGYLERSREGRRNHYTLHPDLPLRHEIESHCSVSDLIDMYKRRLDPKR